MLTTLALALLCFLLLLSFNAALLILFWDSHRIPIALGMCALYTGSALVLGVWIARSSHRGARAFAATRAVLEKDRERLVGARD